MTDFETHPVGTAARIEQLEAALTRANAATAAAYEVAAKAVENDAGEFDHPSTHYTFGRLAAIIRALATPDQTAALDKLIAEAVGPLLIAAKSGLRFIENTESELGSFWGVGIAFAPPSSQPARKAGCDD